VSLRSNDSPFGSCALCVVGASGAMVGDLIMVEPQVKRQRSRWPAARAASSLNAFWILLSRGWKPPCAGGAKGEESKRKSFKRRRAEGARPVACCLCGPVSTVNFNATAATGRKRHDDETTHDSIRLRSVCLVLTAWSLMSCCLHVVIVVWVALMAAEPLAS